MYISGVLFFALFDNDYGCDILDEVGRVRYLHQPTRFLYPEVEVRLRITKVGTSR